MNVAPFGGDNRFEVRYTAAQQTARQNNGRRAGGVTNNKARKMGNQGPRMCVQAKPDAVDGEGEWMSGTDGLARPCLVLPCPASSLVRRLSLARVELVAEVRLPAMQSREPD